MSAKRALVVDDSKSARAFLARMLEKYAIDVDSVENAEQAIAYLVHHRPDVIFMDHLMPGMDGFQAVKAIKDDPRTATIPIMMYTSQEGALYVGQARALGAVGVLPKQIKPTDVSKVLYQLHLLPERRADAQPTEPLHREQPALGAQPAPLKSRPAELELRAELAELRRTLSSRLEDEMALLRAELREELGQVRAATLTPLPAPVEARPAPRGWTGAAIGAVIAAASLAFAIQTTRNERSLALEVSQLHSALALAERPAAPVPSAAPFAAAAHAQPAAFQPDADAEATNAEASASEGTGQASPLIEEVPYGENPLAGPRQETLRELFDRLTAERFHGIIEIRTFPGRFCLVGNATDGYSLAPEETTYAKCDLVGDGAVDSLAQPQSIPLSFADLAAALRHVSHGAIDVQVLAGDDRSTLVPYPQLSDTLTAGEWNRAGEANNRIEIRLR